jgi:DNA-binding NarL/FixJ family response regulator
MAEIRTLREQFGGLLETLTLLQEQLEASLIAIPRQQVQAHLALSVLEILALQACQEAEEFAALLEAPERAAGAGAPALSPRETQVLHLVADGLTNKEIAYRLGLSERTVQHHLNSVFNKTGTYSRTEAVAAGFRCGVL